MKKKLPEIKETEEELERLFKAEKDVEKRQRLQALYLLKAKKAKNRLELASTFCVHRHTIANWLNIYEKGGLSALVSTSTMKRRTSCVSEEVRQDLTTQLDKTEGFASYGEIKDYLEEKHDIELSYSRVHGIVRYELESKLKTPRPSHKKK